jgi:hypothetical protein
MSFLSTTGSITQFARPREQDSSDCFNFAHRYILAFALALISWCKARRSLYDGKLLTMSSWSVLLAWEGHCRPHFIVLGVSDIFQELWRWQRRSLPDFIRFVQDKLLYVKPTTIFCLLSLSQRLALDSNTPQYILRLASPFKAVKLVHERMANRIRACVAIDDEFLKRDCSSCHHLPR